MRLILTNAILVLPDATLHGTLVVRGRPHRRRAVRPLRRTAARDLDGDYLIPGIVDTHTDNLERQVQPRSLARWPSRSAMVAHDAQCAAAGVTTVFDALCLGDLGFDKERIRTFRDGVVDLDALNDADLLKAEHFLHLRCEVPALDMLALFDTVADHALVRMVSLMDHSPGVGQYADLDFYRALRRRGGLDDAYIERRILELQAQRERDCAFRTAAPCSDRIAGRDIAHRQPRRQDRGRNRRERRRRHRHQRVPGHHGGRTGGEGGRHAGDRRRTEYRARRLAFRQRVGGRSAGDRRGRCVRLRLRAEQPGGGGVPVRASASACRRRSRW